MVSKIDDTLLYLAKRLVIIADFFGVALDKLVYGWIIITSVLMYSNYHDHVIISAWIGMVSLGMPVLFNAEKELSHSESILPGNAYYCNQRLRVMVILLIVNIMAFFSIIDDQAGTLVVASKFITVPCYYVYLVMNKGSRSRRRLKTRLARLLVKAKRVRERLRQPDPTPQPLPIPT